MMGRFADAYLQDFDAEQLAQFSALLEEQDRDVYCWVIVRDPVPEEHRTGGMDLLQAFDFTV